MLISFWLYLFVIKLYSRNDIFKHNFKEFPSHYTRPRSSIRSLNECKMSTRNAIRPGPKDQKNKWDIFLSRQGVLYVINKCRTPTPNLINLKECLGIELHKNKWLSKEQDILTKIMQAFNGDEMVLENTELTYIFQNIHWPLNVMSLSIVTEILDAR